MILGNSPSSVPGLPGVPLVFLGGCLGFCAKRSPKTFLKCRFYTVPARADAPPWENLHHRDFPPKTRRSFRSDQIPLVTAVTFPLHKLVTPVTFLKNHAEASSTVPSLPNHLSRPWLLLFTPVTFIAPPPFLLFFCCYFLIQLLQPTKQLRNIKNHSS